ncbi:PREDICTED: TP53-regulating kinase [Nicrophorus vespilloides]|uniref:non-specific serine/threonine protein kinase n=1 Tax=Nicrophorus vespilloides TaxID=110193 RepID=A0ABM1N6V0_NICVS|nr:PREDICTED: TP53-regulating kinase [Nicrophorus vespilloides]
MENFELIKQGAEGRIFKGLYLGKPSIIKERFEKKYRHRELDNHLTKERIKAESKAITKCRSIGIRTPSLYLVDFNRRMIFMEYFEASITAKEFICTASNEFIERISEDIGIALAKMHSNNVVHGDLTTSNILLINKHNKMDFNKYEDLEMVLIDFGLAHIESSAEDKGVDLYVLERALLSTHSIAEQIFPNILKSYKNAYKNCKEVIQKFEDVRARGRKRTMVG